MSMNKARSILRMPTLHNLPSTIFSETELYIIRIWKKKSSQVSFWANPWRAVEHWLLVIRWPNPVTRSQVALTTNSMANVSFVSPLTKLQEQHHHRHEIVHWDEHQNILIKYKLKPNRTEQKICSFSLAKNTACNQNRVCWKGNKYSLQHLWGKSFCCIFLLVEVLPVTIFSKK